MVDREYKDLTKSEKIQRQKEIWKLFTKLGFLAFGGPAAHIAMLETEAIEKRNGLAGTDLWTLWVPQILSQDLILLRWLCW